MLKKLAIYLMDRAMASPWFLHLTGPDGTFYMRRWWLVPYKHMERVRFLEHPIGWLLQRFDIAVRVHHIARKDLDRHLHDHPWNFISVVLRGGYSEMRPIYPERPVFSLGGWEHGRREWHGPGKVLFRRAGDRHRITWVPPGGAWTLFITFRKVKSWGFYTERGFINHRDYQGGVHEQETHRPQLQVLPGLRHQHPQNLRAGETRDA